MTTQFQSNLFQFIHDYLTQYDLSPSFREMTEAMGISPRSKSLITRSLRALEKQGKVILKKEGRQLSISLTTKQLPILGRIAAGEPIEAIPSRQFVNMNAVLQSGNRFALEVKGDSMVEEGILDGDLVICKQMNSAHEGDIVVALIDENYATLKRISYKMSGMVVLIPANPNLKPKAYQPDRVQIQGIYMGLIRLV